MCRLYGFRANELTKVECSLAYAQNALMSQSRADLRGESHPDGWGVAHYDDGQPRIERRDTAAYADLHFSTAAERTYARTVVAHVRRATVGGASLTNTHPFVYGRWSFIHNGTVRAFPEVAPQLEGEIPARLLAHRRGSTDSELVFYWLLALMERAGLDLDADIGCHRVATVMGKAVCTLESRCVAARSEKPAQLNFILTDGHILCASRWRNSLYWVPRYGVHDCEICGIPHVKHKSGAPYRAVVVASEPISDESWEELPDGAVLCVERDVRATTHRI